MELSFDDLAGKGLFGDVWSATDRLGRKVAVKFIRDAGSHEERLAMAHARALARVKHPRVVQILSLEHQHHPESGTLQEALIMDFVAGAQLARVHELPVEAARQIGLDIVDALFAIHDAGLVHGDLHEGNVMVSDDRAVLIDLLYTHSLAEVGTRTRSRQKDDDYREAVRLLRLTMDKVARLHPHTDRFFHDALEQPRTLTRLRQVFLDSFGLLHETSAGLESTEFASEEYFAEVFDYDEAPEQSVSTHPDVARERLLRRLASVGALGYSEHALQRRWKSLFAVAPTTLLENWTERLAGLPSDPGTAVLHVTTIWDGAADLDLVPRERAFQRRPNMRDIAAFYSTRKAGWSCDPIDTLTPVGTRALAQAARPGWRENAWSSSHSLAGPLFEVVWDTLVALDATLAGLRTPTQCWWMAAGGRTDGQALRILPWPAPDLLTFASHQNMIVRWNDAYLKSAKLYKVVADDGPADDLAFWCVEYVHLLWHKSEEVSWRSNVSVDDWKSTIDCLVRTARQPIEPERRAYAEWLRAVPLLAAPESGLSTTAASAILAAFPLDEPHCQDLRVLRERRFRDYAEPSVDSKAREHPWFQYIEGPHA